MPAMGESVTEGTILEWHVAEGEEVSEGDTIVEVSTDKIDAEVPAPASGVITKIMAQPDDTVTVGQVLAQLDTNGTGNGAAPAADAGEEEDPGDRFRTPSADRRREPSSPRRPALTTDERGDRPAAAAAKATPTSARATPKSCSKSRRAIPPTTRPCPTSEDSAEAAADDAGETMVVAMPEMGESVTEGTVLEWHVAEGDSVAEGDTVVEVSTDKVDAEVPAPASGTITKLLVEPDDVVKVGQPLAEMSAGAAPVGSDPDDRRPA